ncbi:MAG: putative TetR family transcriptional regulator [Ilumatobacteraceae bacterium]|nr:putative TetR family transcriptional regulator [Ilumatobacteraceae bacterium]
MSEPGPGVSADGRTARRDRNRDAVLDAVLDLFADGSLTPLPAEVAERSGVSLRSVYRYFDDMDALVRAAIARNLARMGPLFDLEDAGTGSLPGRVERIVAARLRLYDALAPMARAAVARAPHNPIIAERLEETRLLLRRQVEEMFAPELGSLDRGAAGEVVAAVDVLLELDAVDHLRRHRGMGEEEAGRVLVRAVEAQLRAAAPA